VAASTDGIKSVLTARIAINAIWVATVEFAVSRHLVKV